MINDDTLESRITELVDQLTLEQKVRLLTGEGWWSVPAEPAIGLRALVVSDGPAGVRGTHWSELDPSASLPSPTALAASWDVETVRQAAGVLAAEARRKGVDVVLAPTVNLHRSPYGGRHFEGMSEDPLLTAVLGTAYVRGLQEQGVGATAKHYVANESETDRFTVDIQADERTLRELYLAPFERMVVEGGAWLVMAAYNSVDGATMTENPLLAHPLKDEWGFDGVVISDWYAARSTEPAGRAALDLVMPGPSGPWGDALVAAVRDGAVSQEAVDDKVLRLLRLAARVGALDGTEPLPVAQPDLATVLRGAAADGMVLLENAGLLPLKGTELRRVAVIGQLAADARIQGGGSATVVTEHSVSPLEGLRTALGPDVDVTYAVGTRLPESLRPAPIADLDVRWLDADGTLLRQENRRSARLIWLGDAVTEASEVRVSGRLTADATGTWRLGVVGLGRFTLDINGETALTTTLTGDAHHPGEAAVERALTEGDDVDIVVTHYPEPGSAVVGLTLGADRPQPSTADELADAVAIARDADVAIVVVGTTEAVESEGFDRDSLALPGDQDELVKAVANANPRTVVVVNAGAPVLLPWRDEVGTLLLAWFGGQEMGTALADVLLGVREPGGRLPTTWPAGEAGVLTTTPTDGVLRYDEGLHIGYRRDQPYAYPFGHGLGYTTWEYLNITVANQTTVDVEVNVQVRNVGERRGKEVVQVYLSRPDSTIDRPTRWLAGFAVVTADPDEDAIATIRIDSRVWRHWSVADHAWATESGGFVLSAGHSVVDLPLEADLPVT
jgi:beta-glucosidase